MCVLYVYTSKMSPGLGIRAEPLAVTLNLLLPDRTSPAEENSGGIILVCKPGIVVNLDNYSLLFFYHCWEGSSINQQVGIDNHQQTQFQHFSSCLGFLVGVVARDLLGLCVCGLVVFVSLGGLVGCSFWQVLPLVQSILVKSYPAPFCVWSVVECGTT